MAATAASQELVLDLEVLELAGEFSLGGTGNEKQERLVNVGHLTRVRKTVQIMMMALFSHPAEAPFSRIFQGFWHTN